MRQTATNQTPPAAAAACRGRLAMARGELAAGVEAGHSGLELAGFWSDTVAACVTDIFATIFPDGEAAPAAAIALGGFGRRHLAPYSDLDLLLLHRPGAGLEPLLARCERLLWDAGLRPSVLCHTPETVEPAVGDPHFATSIIEPRLLAGGREIYGEFLRRRAAGLHACRSPLARHLLAELDFDDLSALKELNRLQPDLKHDRFMLRDAQRLAWLAALRQPPEAPPDFSGALDMAGSQFNGAAVRRAYDHFLRLRTALHLDAGRGQDTLDYFSQQRLAARLNCQGNLTQRPEEAFLQELYAHSRQVFQAAGAVRGRARRRAFRPSAATQRRSITPLLVRSGGELRLRPGWLSLGRPAAAALLEPFAVAATGGLTISPAALGALRQAAPQLADDAAARALAGQLFRRLLGSRRPVGRVLLQMHFCGLLERLLPAFGALTCAPQFDVYHQYTTDAHSLLALCELDLLAAPRVERALERYRLLFAGVTNLAVLRFAALMHDCGKVQGSPHAVLGAASAGQAARELGFAANDAASIEFLVREHLLLAEASSHRDIAERSLLARIAAAVGSRENLNSLLLLTFADMRAVAAGVWTNWRDERLWTLFRQAGDFLEDAGGAAKDFAREFALYRSRAEVAVPPAELARHVDMMDWPEYTASVPFHRILEHAAAAAGHRRGEVRVLSGEAHGAMRFLIVAADRHGLFSDLVGALTGAGLTILQGACYTRRDGVIIDEFEVLNARTGRQPDTALCARAEEAVGAVARGQLSATDLVQRRRRTYPDAPAHPGLRVRVHVDVDASSHHTVIDVRAPDRTGLLYDLAGAMEAAGLEIRFVRIATHAGQAADSFYVVGPDGGALAAAGFPRLRRLLEDAS